MLWLVLGLIAVGALSWTTTGHVPFFGTGQLFGSRERVIDVEFCDASCAALGAGFAFAKARSEAIDNECERRGPDFASGCLDYSMDHARDMLDEQENPDGPGYEDPAE